LKTPNHKLVGILDPIKTLSLHVVGEEKNDEKMDCCGLLPDGWDRFSSVLCSVTIDAATSLSHEH
jgi:hypothetical protein